MEFKVGNSGDVTVVTGSGKNRKVQTIFQLAEGVTMKREGNQVIITTPNEIEADIWASSILDLTDAEESPEKPLLDLVNNHPQRQVGK